MSEYWKSQPRKFCDFCKCWITDNKPSIDFHEKGKRHQEAVKQRIEDVRKKGAETEKRKQKESDYMARMEKAAMAAFKKDLEANPELAEQYGVKKKEVFEGPQLPEGYSPSAAPDSEGKPEGEDKTEEGEWYEAVSEMGYPYYWNTVTGESVWVAPEKYVSLADQGLAPPAPSHTDEVTDTADTPPTSGNTDLSQEQPATVEEIPLPPTVDSIPLPGEAPPLPPPPEEESESEEEEEETLPGKQDRSARGVYGVWARVQKEHQEQVDLELPQTDNNYETLEIPIISDEPKLKFKEKTVTSLGSNKSGPVAFKKRKLASGAKNVRRRDEDDN